MRNVINVYTGVTSDSVFVISDKDFVISAINYTIMKIIY